MNRRKLLTAGPAAVVLANIGTASAAQAASPILDAGRRIAELNKQHDAADASCGDHAELDHFALLIIDQQRFIIAATPATAVEALVVLIVAVRHSGTAGEGEEGHQEVMVGMATAARASHCLAGILDVTVAEFGAG